MTSTLPLQGTVIGSDLAFAKWAYDGDLGSVCDTIWAGQDFGRKVTVNRIRFVMRFDGDWSGRWAGGKFQIATDASFSDAEDVCDLTSIKPYSPCNKVFEIELPEPVETRFMRFNVFYGWAFASLVAMEFLSDELYERPVLTVVPSDNETFKASCSWVVNPSLSVTKSVLQRSIHQNKGWKTIAETGAGNTQTVVDETLYPGLTYYYRVVATIDTPEFAGQQIVSDSVPYFRYRRLERASSSSSTLLDGVTTLNGYGFSSQMARAFDGDVTTHPDYQQTGGGTGDAAVGVDLGTKCHVYGFSYVARGDGNCGRMVNFKLYGSDSAEAWFDNKVVISGAIGKYDEKYTVFFQKTLDEGQSEYQQVFLYGGWTFGNVAELGFFGWTDADTAYALRKETPGLMLIIR